MKKFIVNKIVLNAGLVVFGYYLRKGFAGKGQR